MRYRPTDPAVFSVRSVSANGICVNIGVAQFILLRIVNKLWRLFDKKWFSTPLLEVGSPKVVIFATYLKTRYWSTFSCFFSYSKSKQGRENALQLSKVTNFSSYLKMRCLNMPKNVFFIIKVRPAQLRTPVNDAQESPKRVYLIRNFPPNAFSAENFEFLAAKVPRSMINQRNAKKSTSFREKKLHNNLYVRFLLQSAISNYPTGYLSSNNSIFNAQFLRAASARWMAKQLLAVA